MKRISIIVVIFHLAGCKNYLETFSQPDTDAARYVEASLALNDRDFDGALVWIGRMSSEYRATREVKYLEASVYSGKCGMEAMVFLQTVDGISGGATKFFAALMAAFKGGTLTQMGHCKTAETLLRSISASASGRTTSENIFLALVSLAKIGIILNEGADLNDDGLVNDGFSSPNHCTDGTIIDNTEVDEMITGLSNFVESLGGGTFGTNELGDITAICSALNTADPTLNFCGITDTANVTANHRRGIRTIFGESTAVGLGICTGDVTTCLCP